MRPLAAADREGICNITGLYPPYSDFNFTSMFSWNVDGAIHISIDRQLLIVRFVDYLTAAPFYMFIGEGNLNDIARQLLRKSERDGFGQHLRLIPECVSSGLDPAYFRAIPDEDHSDYIIDVASLAACQGRKWHRHRTFINRFERENPAARFSLLDLEARSVRRELFQLFVDWCEKKEPDGFRKAEHEYEALRRCVETFAPHLIAGGVYAHDKLVAFALMEQVNAGYAIHHFEKADRWTFCGVIQFLQWQMARLLASRNIAYLNIEQDLGIPGLRKGKRMLHPVAHLRKYEIASLHVSLLNAALAEYST